jgi:hypothetical protein
MSKQDQEYDRDAALANLTPEERAAIEEDDLSPEEKSALEDIAGDDDDLDDDDSNDDDESNDDDDDDSDDDTEAAKKAEPVKKENEQASVDDVKDETPADDDDDGDPQEFRSRYQVQLPDGFADQVKALDEREVEIASKLKSGDIEIEEFVAKNKELATERAKLDRIATKAEIAAEMGEQTAAQEWQWTVEKFMRQIKKDEGIDYRKDETKASDLDTFVKVLAANPANEGRDMEWFLSEAHKRTKALHGVAEKAKTDAKDKKPEAKPSRKPNLDKLPANLSQVPGGDGPGDVTGEFADIDGLDGLAYETALAKMTPAQRERYLATA